MSCNTKQNLIKALKNKPFYKDGAIVNIPEFRSYINQVKKSAIQRYGIPSHLGMIERIDSSSRVIWNDAYFNEADIKVNQYNELQANIAQAEQIQREDSKRSGVDYDENYLFLSRQQTNPEDINLNSPVGDNYFEFLNYKKANLAKIRNRKARVQQSLKTYDTPENRQKLKSLEAKERTLINQIESLQEEQEDFLFHAIIDDLNSIEQQLQEADIANISEISDTLDFYGEFASTLTEAEEFKDIAAAIVKAKADYEKRLRDKVIMSLENSRLVQETLKNLSEEYNRDVTIDQLLVANKDISIFDQQFLGLISSTTGDTVLPQHLMENFRRSFAYHSENANTIIDKLDEFNKKNPGVDREDLFEVDSNGNKTGFLKDLYNSSWFGALKNLKGKIVTFHNAPANQKQTAYNDIVDWYERNTNVIDFTKLKVVRDVYQTKYPEYFQATDEEMSSYDANLKQVLGPRYNDTMQQILNKLQKFEEFKSEIDQNDPYYDKNIAQRNLWKFLKQYNRGDGKKGIAYEYGEGLEATALFSHFGDLPIIPATQERASARGINLPNYYSQEFTELRQDPAKVELWSIYKEMSEQINSTYSVDTFGRISYPKIETQYTELLDKQIEYMREFNVGAISNLPKLFTKGFRAYKEMFYERGIDSRNQDTIVSNYSDSSQKEINDLKRVYMLKGMNPDEAFEKARGEVLKNYSTDLDRNFKAMLIQSAMHDARIETEPIARSIMQVFSNIKDSKGQERKRAIARMKEYVDKIILNKSVVERNTGSVAGRDITRDSNFAKILTLIGESQVGKYLGINASNPRLLSDNERLLLKELRSIDISEDAEINISDGAYKLTKFKDSNGNFVYSVNNSQVTPETFEKALILYFSNKAKDLGLDLNMAGIVDGFIKTTIVKYLGLNPVSGIFNRIEGMFSTMIMDQTGEYWTPGNADTAKEFMSFANIINLNREKFKWINKEKAEQFDIMDHLLKRLNILQDRKNELQRSTDDSKFSTSNLNIFKWAVDNPEYKNQGTVILSVLQDTEVKDNAGNTYQFFDGEKFPHLEMREGVLHIKDEFSESFKLDEDNMLDTILKLETAVSKTQGNYNNLDVMLAKKPWYGRALMLFKTWMAEALNKRWGAESFNNDINVNLFNTSRKREGYMLKALQSNPSAMAMYTAGAIGISYGTLGLAGLVGGGLLGAYVIGKTIKNVSTNTIVRDITNIQEITNFLQAVTLETLNMPSRLASSIPGVKHLRFDDKTYRKTNLRPEDVGAVKALARELAIMLSMLGIKLAMGALLYDEEDDKDSFDRKFHNMVQNQLSRSITTLQIYTDPQAITNDASNFVLSRTLTSVASTMDALLHDNDPQKAGGYFLESLAIPSAVTKLVKDGDTPLEHKKNYDFINFNMTKLDKPLKWASTKIEVSEEQAAKKEVREIRKEAKEKLKEEFPNKDEKFYKKKLDRMFPPKKKNQSYKVTLDKYKKRLE